MKRQKKSKITLILSLIFSALLFSSAAISSDDAYLNALDAEAENSASTQKTNTTSSTTAQDSTKNLQLIQRKIEFTTLLSNELPATSRTYYKLNETQQQQVIDIYFDNNKSMSKATHLLFNLYFKNNTATSKKGS